ncbi:MAG: hypothetical protein IJV13_09865 [Prevotella sp.]|nr:hypothetical protein [Prevotella sp.]
MFFANLLDYFLCFSFCGLEPRRSQESIKPTEGVFIVFVFIKKEFQNLQFGVSKFTIGGGGFQNRKKFFQNLQKVSRQPSATTQKPNLFITFANDFVANS